MNQGFLRKALFCFSKHGLELVFITQKGKCSFRVEKEKPLSLTYQEIHMECGYRIDLLVEEKLLLELKSVEYIKSVHVAQTLTYMKLGNYKLGLLINFNVPGLKDGIKRIINGL